MSLTRSVILHVLLLGAAAASAHGGSIRLRTSAMVDAGEAVRVGDVATLEGDDALALAHVTILAEPSRSAAGRAWVEVTLADLRRSLDEAGARAGMLTLSGGVCTVRIASPPKDAAPEPTPKKAKPRPESVDPSGTPTVRKQAMLTLSSFLEVDPSDLRLLFDQSDADFLDQPRHALRIAIVPASGSGSARSVMNVRILDGDRIIDHRTIRAEAEVRRRVVVLQTMVKRKDAIPASALSEQEMWMPVGRGRPLERLEDASGALARTRLEPGTILREEHLESPVVIRRNELATIHAVREGFVVQTRARARSEGRRGDVIEFRVDGSKRGFQARVDGPGVAVVDLERTSIADGSKEAEE